MEELYIIRWKNGGRIEIATMENDVFGWFWVIGSDEPGEAENVEVLAGPLTAQDILNVWNISHPKGKS